MSTIVLTRSFFQKPLRMIPHFAPRPWGGDGFRRVLGKEVPEGLGPVGESWELSDHPDGRSRVFAPGSGADGITFGGLVRLYPLEMVGVEEAPQRYPLLVKYIDAAGDLSVQVHPDDAWCRQKGHDDRGKSECWYIMDAPPGTEVIYGYKDDTTEDAARQALGEGILETLLKYKTVKPGDFLAVPPRTVHAMLSGLLVCEIQQSSNTTFRLYDWNRQPPRQLHVEDSMDVTEWDNSRLPPFQHHANSPAGVYQLVENEFFTVTLHVVPPNGEVTREDLNHASGAILNVVGGNGEFRGDACRETLALGDTWFLPAAATGPFTLKAGDRGLRLLRSVSKEITPG
jgi:mannose-6-phosphate isomerase